MNKLVACITLPILVSSLYGSGYRIPEQSGDSIAFSAANVAKSFGPDSAYYNPANMPYLDSLHQFEISNTYLYLGKTKFDNYSNVPGTKDATSRYAKFLVPAFHFVSPQIGQNWRVGLSFAVPAGISIKWRESYPRTTAEVFSLQIFELNPSIAYQFNDNMSLALGLRMLYSNGKTQNQLKLGPIEAQRKLKGDSVDFGYNLALTYRPIEQLSLSTTYRSKVNLTLKGDADIHTNLMGNYKGGAKISIPLPAVWSIGASYDISNFTFMATLERTFWSSFKQLDFNYDKSVPLPQVFDEPNKKHYRDSNAYRLALAHQTTEKLRLMIGFAYDEAATKNDRVGFELPDTKAYIYSIGGNYQLNSNLALGASLLYQDRQDRVINHQGKTHADTVVGKFKNPSAILTNFNISYKF